MTPDLAKLRAHLMDPESVVSRETVLALVDEVERLQRVSEHSNWLVCDALKQFATDCSTPAFVLARNAVAEVERLNARVAQMANDLAEADAWPAKYRAQLKAENQRLEAENKKLSDLLWRAEREPAPCRHCGTLLSWHFLGDGTNYVEAATGKPHQCLSTDELVANGLREIARLKHNGQDLLAENERLREALRPFAEVADRYSHYPADAQWVSMMFGDCRLAREVLG